jgi:hypothetical protein
MAKLILNGATSGSISLESPAVSGSNTLTLPANTGTVLTTASTFGGTGPAFSAYRNGNQTGFASATNTKVEINAENFDTNNNFDSTTNYRFTPTVAGYYQVNAVVDGAGTNLNYLQAKIFKNGSNIATGSFDEDTAAEKASAVSTVVFLNGSTDYIELYFLGIVTSGTILLVGNSVASTTFSASMVRGA